MVARYMKTIQIIFHDTWSMLLSGQVPHTRKPYNLSYNLRNMMLAQTYLHRLHKDISNKKIFHPLLIDCYENLIAVQNVECKRQEFLGNDAKAWQTADYARIESSFSACFPSIEFSTSLTNMVFYFSQTILKDGSAIPVLDNHTK